MIRLMRVNGVLIEGVDFVGKTSAVSRLVEIMQSEGRVVQPGKCYLRRSPVIDYLEDCAKSYRTMIDRDMLYTAALLADLATYEPSPTFIVQDRHWLTQIGRNQYFHPNRELVSNGTIERLRIPFKHNVFLKCDMKTKLERCRSREPNSPRDEYLAANPSAHQEFEALNISLIPAETESWVILDTSDLTIDEVASKIYEYVDRDGATALDK
jgi:thymidylate kinase